MSRFLLSRADGAATFDLLKDGRIVDVDLGPRPEALEDALRRVRATSADTVMMVDGTARPRPLTMTPRGRWRI